tara:strand:- start:400 stop:732 length:333 start_codon:yes stop_codon:yes gene_type:complete
MEHLLQINEYNIIEYNNYSFLDIFNEYIDSQLIYNYINSYKSYQLINIYYFIKTRLFILNKLVDIKLTELPSLNKIDHKVFDHQLTQIINENIYIAIFIINSILLYGKTK